MRLIAFLLLFSAGVKAQTFLPFNSTAFTQRPVFLQSINYTDSNANKKCFFTHSAGVSTSFSFFKGGNATIIAAPISLQLNRKLNENLYAFAAVSAAPAYINFNQKFLNTDISKTTTSNNFLRSNNFGMFTRAEVGLMYVNDAKTFSISGSFGIERSNFPIYQFNQINTVNPNASSYPVMR